MKIVGRINKKIVKNNQKMNLLIDFPAALSCIDEIHERSEKINKILPSGTHQSAIVIAQQNRFIQKTNKLAIKYQNYKQLNVLEYSVNIDNKDSNNKKKSENIYENDNDNDSNSDLSVRSKTSKRGNKHQVQNKRKTNKKKIITTFFRRGRRYKRKE